MRTWLSKANGYVTEKPNDSFTGVLTNSGEKIYEGDTILVTKMVKKYIGKYHPVYTWRAITEKEYNNSKNWKIEERQYTGKVYYLDGRYFIDLPSNTISDFDNLYRSEQRLEIYHDMIGERNYGFYNIEILK